MVRADGCLLNVLQQAVCLTAVCNVLQQTVCLTSEFKDSDRSPQAANYVKPTVITFCINCVRTVWKLTFKFA
jgi:hypothetical protein